MSTATLDIEDQIANSTEELVPGEIAVKQETRIDCMKSTLHRGFIAIVNEPKDGTKPLFYHGVFTSKTEDNVIIVYASNFSNLLDKDGKFVPARLGVEMYRMEKKQNSRGGHRWTVTLKNQFGTLLTSTEKWLQKNPNSWGSLIQTQKTKPANADATSTVSRQTNPNANVPQQDNDIPF